MPKIKYTVPKGSKDCNGQECKQDLQFDIDIPETKPTTQIIPTPQIDYSNLAQLQTQPLIPAADHTHKHEETKKITHEDIKELMPKGLNLMACPGGNCGNEPIINPIQTKKFKTCPNGNCEANTVPKDSKNCPYCKKGINPDDDLDDGIDLTDDDDE